MIGVVSGKISQKEVGWWRGREGRSRETWKNGREGGRVMVVCGWLKVRDRRRDGRVLLSTTKEGSVCASVTRCMARKLRNLWHLRSKEFGSITYSSIFIIFFSITTLNVILWHHFRCIAKLLENANFNSFSLLHNLMLIVIYLRFYRRLLVFDCCLGNVSDEANDIFEWNGTRNKWIVKRSTIG